MILQTAQLSPNQRAVIEELVGRKLLDHETFSLCACGGPELSDPRRETPADKTRRLLAAMDCSERRMTDAEWADALLGAAGREYPA